jgi:antitoxin MazE
MLVEEQPPVARVSLSLERGRGCNYNVAMKARIVKIGNSQGVRIPKLLLERSNLAEEVELEAQNHQIIIRSARHPRQNWESAFRAMAERGDDELLDKNPVAQTLWDEAEWQW